MYKLIEALWERGVPISLKEAEKWGIVDDPEIADPIKEIFEKAGNKEYVPLLVANQAKYMGTEGVKKIAGFKDPLAHIIEFRKGEWHPEACEKNVESPSYIEHVSDLLDFFLNVLKYEFGVDVEGLLENVKAVVGEEYVGDFLRLVDIDGVYTPEEFAKRVDVGLSALMKAREQGMDVGEIIRKWDELAEGERLAKLADAVRVTAEEFVRGRFWKGVADTLEEKGVHVFLEPVDEMLGVFYSLGMVDVEENNVKIEGMEDYLALLSEILKNYRAVPLYKTGEIAEIMVKTGAEKASTKEELLFCVSVLSKLTRKGIHTYLETPYWKTLLEEIIKSHREGKENVNEILERVLAEIASGNLSSEEDILNFIHQLKK